MEPIRKFLGSMTGMVVMVIAVIGVLILAWWLIIGRPQHAKEAEARARAGQIIGQAGQNAASDATGAIAGLGEKTEDRNRKEQDAIRDIQGQPGAGSAVDPGVYDATLRGLCKQPGYRDERCDQVR